MKPNKLRKRYLVFLGTLAVYLTFPFFLGSLKTTFLLSFLITFSLLSFSPRLLRPLTFTALLTVSIINLGYFLYSGKSMDFFFWLALFSTNPHETASFFTGLGLLNCFYLFLYAALGVGAFLSWRPTKRRKLLYKAKVMGYSFLSIVLLMGLEFKLYNQWRLNQARNIYPVNFFASYFDTKKYVDRLILPTTQITSSGKPYFDRIIVILGESLTSKRMSLYGYQRDTTPHLNANKEIIVYNELFALGINTQPNLLTFFSGKVSSSLQAMSFDVIRLAKAAGVETIYLDNNKYQDRDPIFLIGNQSNRFVSLNGIGDTNAYTDQKIKLDQVLTSELESSLSQKTPEKPQFILVHTAGSHPRQENRYPQNEFKRFPSHYDNSVLYTDHLINKWMEIVKPFGTKERILIVFVSDHGVKLPPGCGLGEIPKEEWTDYGADDRYLSNLTVPLFFWMSQKAVQELPELRANLLLNRNKKLDHRFFLPSMAHILGIREIGDYPNFLDHSLFQARFKEQLPRINHYGLDVDQALKDGKICSE